MHRIALIALRGDRRGRSPFAGAAGLAMLPLRPKPFDLTAPDSTARLRPLAGVPYAVGFIQVAPRGRRGISPTEYALSERVRAIAWEIRMPDTETPIAGARRRRTRSRPALQEAWSRQRQDRRPLFLGRPPPAAPARRNPRPDGPVPARRGPQRALPQARAAAHRRGVGLGPRTQRPGADTPRAVVPPSSGTQAAALSWPNGSVLQRSPAPARHRNVHVHAPGSEKPAGI